MSTLNSPNEAQAKGDLADQIERHAAAKRESLARSEARRDDLPTASTGDESRGARRLRHLRRLLRRRTRRRRESIPYVAGWGEGGALDAIREYAETIDTVARRIEAALDDDSTPAMPARSVQVRDLKLARRTMRHVHAA